MGLNTWCHSISVTFKSHSISVTFKSCAVRVALCALEPHSTDSLGTQHQNLKVTLIEWYQVFTPYNCALCWVWYQEIRSASKIKCMNPLAWRYKLLYTNITTYSILILKKDITLLQKPYDSDKILFTFNYKSCQKYRRRKMMYVLLLWKLCQGNNFAKIEE